MYKKIVTKLASRKLIIEINKFAKQANGSVFISYGNTSVLSTVVFSKNNKKNTDFFPLNVEYEEKLYSIGVIPKNFNKREIKYSNNSILISRAIDRTIRPLFEENYKNNVILNNTLMSFDKSCDPKIVAMLGSFIAIKISDIPFDYLCSSTIIGIINNDFIINPTLKQKKISDLYLTVSSIKDRIIMIEAKANEISEKKMLKAILFAHEINNNIINFMSKIIKNYEKDKKIYKKNNLILNKIFSKIKKIIPYNVIKNAICTKNVKIRKNNINLIIEKIKNKFDTNNELLDLISNIINKYQKKIVRKMILKENKRVDGRNINEIRKISFETNLIPNTHGSAIFTRGETQVCTVTTLAPISEINNNNYNELIENKRYIHHYNFPSYSTGEISKNFKYPKRREIGHGILSENALLPVLPSKDKFPYMIRNVSEVFESNGSTSQASVCSSSISLMSAGVPIKEIVAGISCGLINCNYSNNEYIILTDIQGIEDFCGDMDFKISRTINGITAMQVDIKIIGLTKKIIIDAIYKCKNAIQYIIKKMSNKYIIHSKKYLNKNALKVCKIKIDENKIGSIIGKNGKIINNIIDKTGVKIDINDSGTIFIYDKSIKNINKVIKYIKIIINGFKKNHIYNGKIININKYIIFLEFFTGKKGIVRFYKNYNNNYINNNFFIGQHINVNYIGKNKFNEDIFNIYNLKM